MEIPIPSHIGLYIIFFCIALTVRSLFAFLETSITALRLYKLKELARQTSAYETLFAALEKNPHKVLVATLIVSSIAEVSAATLAATIMERIFMHLNLSGSLGFSAGIGLASICLILFGEILPKSLAKGEGRSEKIFKSMLWLISMLYQALSPLVNMLISISDAIVHRISGKSEISSEWISSEQEIQFLIRYIHGKGLIEQNKTQMLQNIFDIGSTMVKEIMVPATEIISIPITHTLQETLQIFSTYRFTRLPVYQETQDNIIGMIHLKDILNVLHHAPQHASLSTLIRPIMFIPETIKVSQLLHELQKQHVHIAIVLNEYGIVTGLITLEDILEEIVGEINDEHEFVTQKIVSKEDGAWLVDATTALEDIQKQLGITLDAEESATLGGFLTERLQRLPSTGEELLYKGYRLLVQQATPRRVSQVLISKEDQVAI